MVYTKHQIQIINCSTAFTFMNSKSINNAQAVARCQAYFFFFPLADLFRKQGNLNEALNKKHFKKLDVIQDSFWVLNSCLEHRTHNLLSVELNLCCGFWQPTFSISLLMNTAGIMSELHVNPSQICSLGKPIISIQGT